MTTKVSEDFTLMTPPSAAQAAVLVAGRSRQWLDMVPAAGILDRASGPPAARMGPQRYHWPQEAKVVNWKAPGWRLLEASIEPRSNACANGEVR